MATEATIAPTLGEAVLFTQDGPGTSTGYNWIDIRRAVEGARAFQQGVFDATGWKVSEDSGGASMDLEIAANVGIARVDGSNVTHQSNYIIAPHSAVITLTVPAADPTNPRVDQMVLVVRDSDHDGGVNNDARVVILEGDPTAGATLDNAAGTTSRASLPDNCILLAEWVTGAGVTTISDTDIRDRRQTATGARFRVKRNADEGGGSDYTTTGTSFAAIDSSNLNPRIECSGKPLRIRLEGVFSGSASAQIIGVTPMIDSAEFAASERIDRAVSNTSEGDPTILEWEITPTAGSHKVGVMWSVNTGTGTLLARASSFPVVLSIEELRAGWSND